MNIQIKIIYMNVAASFRNLVFGLEMYKNMLLKLEYYCIVQNMIDISDI